LCRVESIYLSSEEEEEEEEDDDDGGNRVNRSGTVPTEDIRDGG